MDWLGSTYFAGTRRWPYPAARKNQVGVSRQFKTPQMGQRSAAHARPFVSWKPATHCLLFRSTCQQAETRRGGCYYVGPVRQTMMVDPLERVARLAAESAVVIFSVSTCCMCHAVKRLFCGMGVHPTVHELDQDPRGKEMERALMRLLGNSAAVPVVFIGGKLNPINLSRASNMSNAISQQLCSVALTQQQAQMMAAKLMIAHSISNMVGGPQLTIDRISGARQMQQEYVKLQDLL
ncbi:hypothetical protein TEA_030196 [Camellia sinensis var. sinensis]|uniref:Glutaredoxin domain-containing protein n=1 Tax=Camellia sinensis var. sinensis TaxID=542762 RepID=A0A4S4E5H7_CAMSN|nr:hypothetical protein TEA_030196 [Camellia sinensis var. sinensis]